MASLSSVISLGGINPNQTPTTALFAIPASIAGVQRSEPWIFTRLSRVIALVHITLALPCGEQKGQNLPVKYWELVADKLITSSWSWGCISGVASSDV
jgi:hypothetical protein